MDTKNNVTTTSTNRVAGVASNITQAEGAGGTDTRTIDMSGTNMPDATNAKTPTERAHDVKEVEETTRDASVPSVPVKKVKILLSRPIVNNGIDYDAGDTLEVKESTAAYLREIGYCKEVN